MLDGQLESGLQRAVEALAMAERLGSDELQIHALTTIGSAKEFLGDMSGRHDLERAAEIGRAANSPMVAGALNNLSVVVDTTDARRVQDLQREALREAERFGDFNMMRFARGNLIASSWMLGEWDEAVAAADEFVAECEQGSPHILEGPSRLFRGYITLARGNRNESLEDFRRALELARRSGADPDSLIPALVRNAWANLQLGRLSEARALFAEAVPVLRKHPYARPWVLAEVAVDLGETLAIRDIAAALPPSPAHRAMVAVLDEDFEAATELYAAAGHTLFEAEARLRASEQLLATGRRDEGEAELEKALSFYRSVRATLFIQRGEALLAKSA
jgi:tetratricopeptide (TPR) repeat protein